MESRIQEDLLQEDVEQSCEVLLQAYNDMLRTHQAYRIAKQGDSEVAVDESEDVRWLETLKQTKANALTKQGKADEEIRAAETRTERQRS